MSEVFTLRDVVERLDKLIAMLKLLGMDTFLDVKRETLSDPICRAILDVADGTRNRQELIAAVIEATGAGDSTIRGRISDLAQKGFIQGNREGNQVYYGPTGLFD